MIALQPVYAHNLIFLFTITIQRSVADEDISNETLEGGDISHTSLLRVQRSISHGESDIVSVARLLSRGDWYIGVFNDALTARTIRAVIGRKRQGSKCPNKCTGHGTCEDGKCRCYPQFSGTDCSKSKYDFFSILCFRLRDMVAMRHPHMNSYKLAISIISGCLY